MREYPPIATEDEIELLSFFDFFEEWYKKEIPVTDFQKAEMKKDFANFEMMEGQLKKKWVNRAKPDTRWTTIFTEKCPECGKIIKSVPLAEIKLDNGWTYDQFYCDTCYLNFPCEQPNNSPDQVAYLEEYIKFLKEVDADGVPGYVKKGYSKSKYRKLEEHLRLELANFREYAKKYKSYEESNLLYFETVKSQVEEYRLYKANLEKGMSIYDPKLNVAQSGS